MISLITILEKKVWEPYDIELHRAHGQIRKTYKGSNRNLIDKGFARRFVDKGRQLAKVGDLKKAKGLARGARVMMSKK